ncbi:Myo-inositol 2-dehydrogenase [Labilithrix luteola]|uniref:Myo-inositol 2-dehydrogenase n=1 Tax=Labilithrix luteola TaxID=1391654 RepID=A0A0K1PS10_9BACT|nr:Gfo/Idh/MocA family oxidoreductase [Labilithrix luteola]AKU96302.1 Myo-inositol 2-dehydrogenase [Labilithrix luteola]
MAAKIKTVLVGLGRMGKNHLRVLRDTPGIDLKAVVDAQAVQPGDLGSIGFCRTLAELKSIDFDAAVIATPTATHHAVALELIGMGKHLLVEKPIASTFEQGREVLEAAANRGVKLAVGHVERFNPAVRKLREIIKEGFLGTPIHFSFTRVGGYPETVITGNNVILDLAVHDIDVLRSLVGAVKLEHSMCHVTWRENVFDTAEIFLASSTGASASVHVNWITPTKIRSIRVTGTRGVCFVDYILQTCELYGGSLLRPVEPTNIHSFDSIQELYRATDKIQFGVQKEEPLRAQAKQFHRFVTEGDAGELCTGRDAHAAVLLAERAMQVEQTRARPTSLPPNDGLLTAADEWI